MGERETGGTGERGISPSPPLLFSQSVVADAAVWDAALLSLPSPHILQSWAWAELKAQTGWRAKRLIWDDAMPLAAAPHAAASLLIRRLDRRLPVAVAYIPKGPILDWSNASLVDAVLAGIEREAWRAGALFVKIDPDVRADVDAGQVVIAALRRRGWRPSAEQIQYRNTVVSDLTPDEAALLAAMKPKWRYNIRLAERRGVAVRDGTAADLPAFYAMYAETGRRDGFLVRPFEYYHAIWSRFLLDGLGHVLLAEVEAAPVAGLFLFRYGPTAWYFYGASTAQSRDLMPNHALQWAAMRWAKAAGCTRYDWWGAPDVLDESDPMWGVYRFKQGFGGEFTPWIGAWDYPASRAGYWAYTVAMPKVLDVMRGRHAAGIAGGPAAI
jgi:lipid II:glycine glycyltransferase (peptidoglycan interpeptide bridge formation enzyme)